MIRFYLAVIYVPQESAPMRPKSMNYINTPSIMNMLSSVVNAVMNEKMKQRVLKFLKCQKLLN